jgi:FkbM family methyltransferase
VSKNARSESFLSRDARIFSEEFNVNAMDVQNAMRASHSQIYQDVFALAANAFTHGGTFIDVGASDGYRLSNSFLLEFAFSWSGVVVEPNPRFRRSLERRRATHSPYAVGCDIKKVDFELVDLGLLSTVRGYEPQDMHAASRIEKSKNTQVHNVRGTTLEAILETSGLESPIGFLSLDIEGLEYEVLNSLDHRRWSFTAIAVEHNFTDKGHKICNLLENAGYRQVMQKWTDFESWFVRK